jgi:hypothetical protein
VIIIIIVLRIRKAIQGTKVNVKKTIMFSVRSVPVAYVIPYFAVVVAATYCSYVC